MKMCIDNYMCQIGNRKNAQSTERIQDMAAARKKSRKRGDRHVEEISTY